MAEEQSKENRTGILETAFTIISALLLLALIGTLLVESFKEDKPPAFELQTSAPEKRGDFLAVSVMVHNTGDDTAKAVQVRGEAPVPGDDPARGEATMDWLPGKSRRFVTILFPANADAGKVDVKIVGYEEP